MDKVIEIFLTKLKSKPPLDYSADQLYDFAMDSMTFYRYCDDSETRYQLKKVFDVIVKHFNTMRRGSINPGTPEIIDKEEKR